MRVEGRGRKEFLRAAPLALSAPAMKSPTIFWRELDRNSDLDLPRTRDKQQYDRMIAEKASAIRTIGIAELTF